MDRPTLPRRDFVGEAARLLSGGWLALQLPALATLAACARDAALSGEPMTTLTAAEASAMGAFAARLIPSDDELPGAEEAGALHFIDRALDGPFADILPPIRAGLADLDARSRGGDPAATGFGTLPTDRQDAIIRDLETTEFFALARLLTVLGVFADPSYGGNRADAGRTILGYEPHGSYQPPFGFYDAEVARAGGDA